MGIAITRRYGSAERLVTEKQFATNEDAKMPLGAGLQYTPHFSFVSFQNEMGQAEIRECLVDSQKMKNWYFEQVVKIIRSLNLSIMIFQGLMNLPKLKIKLIGYHFEFKYFKTRFYAEFKPDCVQITTAQFSRFMLIGVSATILRQFVRIEP